ncbi:hypothetical protein BJ165DRAFT_1467044 [Panaeolus papilionaceus]|nr:hypothetical protein BJ165DRAFT_1467044 [Panaeolus papilionaceus]
MTCSTSVIYDPDACTTPLLSATPDAHLVDHFEPPDNQETTQPPSHFLTFLILASLATSLLAYIFALITISLTGTYRHALPSIIASFSSVPFHVAAIYGIWHAKRRKSCSIFRFRNAERVMVLSYLGFLHLVWIFPGVMAGVAVVASRSGKDVGNSERGSCSGWARGATGAQNDSSACLQRFIVISTISAILTSIEVILLGIISGWFITWNSNPSAKRDSDALERKRASLHIVSLREEKSPFWATSP